MQNVPRLQRSTILLFKRFYGSNVLTLQRFNLRVFSVTTAKATSSFKRYDGTTL